MATARQCIAHFKDIESIKYTFSSPISIVNAKRSLHFSSNQTVRNEKLGSLSMNGCGGDPRAPIGTVETMTFPTAANPALAADRLNSALYNLKSDPSELDSGIIRIEIGKFHYIECYYLQVPIQQQIESLDWLHSQDNSLLPRCYFSGRDSTSLIENSDENDSSHNQDQKKRLVSVAGLGTAVSFRHLSPFSMEDWHSIRRFLSKKCPLIRAYGAIRFDGRSEIGHEWKDFGSFYFMVPQVEFDEFDGSSMIAATIAWDRRLSKTYEQAIAEVEATLRQISSAVRRLNGNSGHARILHQAHFPDEPSWHSAVNHALELIAKEDTSLLKVVLARSSRVLTTVDVDPLDWLTSLKGEGDNAFQFCLQPPEGPAFIGNTPERLFYRNQLRICSEALAATRARGRSEHEDMQIGNDLLSSVKDHNEFAIVRESIRRKLESVCSSTTIEPRKALRKLPRVQHLYAKLTGMLQREDDEFKMLSLLHPTPAVCGHPTQDARNFISQTETFDRGMYAGPVGYFGGAESEFAVGIRSALVGKGGAILYAGTGIVEGSKPSMEWEELNLKTSQFTKLMTIEESVEAIKA